MLQMSNWQSGSKRLSAAKSRQIDLKVHRWLQEQSEHSMSPAKAAKKIRSTQEQDPPLLQVMAVKLADSVMLGMHPDGAIARGDLFQPVWHQDHVRCEASWWRR